MDDITSLVAKRTPIGDHEILLDLVPGKVPNVTCRISGETMVPMSLTIWYTRDDEGWDSSYALKGPRIKTDGSPARGRHMLVDYLSFEGPGPEWLTALIEHYRPTT